jgi:hypothetical protein
MFFLYLLTIGTLVVDALVARLLMGGIAIVSPEVVVIVREFLGLDNSSDGLHLSPSSLGWSTNGINRRLFIGWREWCLRKRRMADHIVRLIRSRIGVR